MILENGMQGAMDFTENLVTIDVACLIDLEVFDALLRGPGGRL